MILILFYQAGLIKLKTILTFLSQKMANDNDKIAWELLKSYFEYTGLIHHQIKSFDDFLTFGVQEIVDQECTVETKNCTVRFGQVSIGRPQITEDIKAYDLFPMDCRQRDLSYDAPIQCDITESFYQDNKKVVKNYTKVTIGRMPIMLGSAVCNLTGLSYQQRIDRGECPNDVGGYFIIRGKERVLVGQPRQNYNEIIVLKQKAESKYKYVAEVRSMSNETAHSVLIKVGFSVNDRDIDITLPFMKRSLPVGIVFQALGYTTEEEITAFLALDNPKIKKYAKYIVRDSMLPPPNNMEKEYPGLERALDPENTLKTAEWNLLLKTLAEKSPHYFATTPTQRTIQMLLKYLRTEEALKYMGQFIKHVTDQKIPYVKEVVETRLFPHMGITATTKEYACFIGYMVKKLLYTVHNIRLEDDRDHMANKRIEVAGILMADMFRNLFKKYTQNIWAALDKRKNPDILTVISRDTSITKKLYQALAIGNWGTQSYVRTGVSQILDRMTFTSTLSHLRRISIQAEREGKNTAIRQIHSSSFGFLCPSETPEGSKIGVVLNLAMTCRVTRRIPTVQVKETLEKIEQILPVEEVKIEEIVDLTPVFVNNALFGYTKEPALCVELLKKMRAKRLLNGETSITFNTVDNVVKIFCDEGRLIRPLLTVKDGKVLAYELVQKLKSNTAIKHKKIVKESWSELVRKGHVQYFDALELDDYVVAMTPERLELQRCDFCEIHPVIQLGMIAAFIPFPDHTQAPRVVYECIAHDTEVAMANGTIKQIKDIKVGEEVFTVDPQTSKISTTKVIHQYVRKTDKKMVKVSTISGRTLVCTEDHLILTKSGWKQASSLIEICHFYKGKLTFEKVSVIPHKNTLIADITTESENHSFLLANGICVHNCSMMKQALGIPTTSYNLRTDTLLHVLYYPQKPIVDTKIARMVGLNEMPYGINAIVAICTYSGFNQEDSVMMNKSAIERGLFCLTSYHTIECSEKKRDTYSIEKIQMPPKESDPSIKEGQEGYFRRKTGANYALLDEQGIVRPRLNGRCTMLKKGDVIVGKITINSTKSGQETLIDSSVVIQSDNEGTVDRVLVLRGANDVKLIKVVIRVTRQPTIGDKMASREAQKGTISMVYPQEDMPFTSSGIVPDIIMSPLAIPSRMTVNQLLECILGKKCALSGTYGDATPFTRYSENVSKKIVQELEEILRSKGWESLGTDKYSTETMYNGFTGEEFQAKIFIGPTFYQRLKHMVDDKMHGRSTGAVVSLTRQPAEGRSRDGGLRFGEMERDCIISHGASRILKERLFEVSDPFTIPVCRNCGVIVASKENKECHVCKGDSVDMCNLPYASKLLFTELMAFGLKMQIKPADK